MILEFSAKNYRSIKDEITLKFEASTSIKDPIEHGFTMLGNTKVLNSMAFYGANSSGKTNVFMAVSLMKRMVIQSVKLNDNERLPFDPFLLSARVQCPTKFEIVFIDNGDKITYGFTYTKEKIVSEWLYAKFPRKSLKKLLERDKDRIVIDEQNYIEGASIKDGTVPLNSNRLFVSLAAQLGGVMSKRIIEWFRSKIMVISGLHDDIYSQYTKKSLHNNEKKKAGILDLLSSMDLGFTEVTTRLLDIDSLEASNSLPSVIIRQMRDNPPISAFSTHKIYNEQGDVVGTTEFDIEERESSGTNKLFNLAGPIMDSLVKGATLLIDELDAQMHPLISRRIVKIFNSDLSNNHGAQLIFTTHDTNMLMKPLLRRDQIMFVEKSNTEVTKVTPMLDIKLESGHKPRTDSNYEKNYLEGKYGAIPYLQEGSLWNDDDFK